MEWILPLHPAAATPQRNRPRLRLDWKTPMGTAACSPGTTGIYGPLPAPFAVLPPRNQPPGPGPCPGWRPVHIPWTREDRSEHTAGIWHSTPCIWCIQYQEWDYCRILSGQSILIEDGQPPQIVQPGDSFLLRPGFTGTRDVVETTTKAYVTLVPGPHPRPPQTLLAPHWSSQTSAGSFLFRTNTPRGRPKAVGA